MNTVSPIPAPPPTRTLAEVQSSFKEFQRKVDANYRELFADPPTPAHKKRLLFHVWLGGVAGALKKKK